MVCSLSIISAFVQGMSKAGLLSTDLIGKPLLDSQLLRREEYCAQTALIINRLHTIVGVRPE